LVDIRKRASYHEPHRHTDRQIDRQTSLIAQLRLGVVIISTFLADVGSLEIGEEVFLARLEQVHRVVGDGDGTMTSSGATPVEMLQHIGPAADLVLGRQTLAARVDASVARFCHDDYRVGAAAGVERVRETVLTQLCTVQQHNSRTAVQKHAATGTSNCVMHTPKTHMLTAHNYLISRTDIIKLRWIN